MFNLKNIYNTYSLINLNEIKYNSNDGRKMHLGKKSLKNKNTKKKNTKQNKNKQQTIKQY